MKVGCLVIEEGPGRGSSFSLQDLTVFDVGRAPGCHVRLRDPRVPANLLRLCRSGECFTLYSISQRAPVRVNGHLVEKGILPPGARIEAGPLVIRFDLVGPEALAHVQKAATAPKPGDTGTEAAEEELVALTGPDRGAGFRIERGRVLGIGRGQDQDIRLDDTKVSRAHCRILAGQDRVTISDLGSTNGTVVNGRRVNLAPLRPGDYIRLGLTVLEYRVG
ncbi:MAG: FHA domain-containing protein [Planctomycetes bacterium]|nr:FHA domain-containing protein [Planctomycetota bacterium]